MVMVVLILIGDLKVNFTAWLNLTTVENSLIRSAIISLVVTHIEFAHIRPPKVVSTLLGGFRVDFSAWYNLTAVENRLVRKAIFSLVVTHIGFAHIRPLKVVLIHF